MCVVPIAIRTRHYHTLAVASGHASCRERREGSRRWSASKGRALRNERVSTEFGKSPQSRWTRAIASRRPDAHCECPMSPPSDPSISHVSRMYLAHAPSPRPDPASPQRGGQIRAAPPAVGNEAPLSAHRPRRASPACYWRDSGYSARSRSPPPACSSCILRTASRCAASVYSVETAFSLA